MVENRNSVLKIISAIIITIITSITLLLSLFTLPVELLVFNAESYYPVIEDETFEEEFSPVVSQVITNQLLGAGDIWLPKILGNRVILSHSIEKYIPNEWMGDVFTEVINKFTSYFNFKTLYTTIEVDIEDLKTAMKKNSQLIAKEYLASLKNCTQEEDSFFQADAGVEIDTLPMCQPSVEKLGALFPLLSGAIEDKVNQLPLTINVTGLIPEGFIMGDVFFYYYSIFRWVFRLLPFITLILLIFIAQLLKNNKKRMRKWIGSMLTIVSGVNIICLLTLLVGFDQFTGLLFKRYFSRVIAGFGDMLLGMIQSVGMQVVKYVIGSSAVVLVFGLLLLLAARVTKIEKREKETVDDVDEFYQPEKEIAPETLEEIEKEEEEKGKSKKE